MSANVSNLKEQFADLKYEQLLTDKYFVETCFSKKFESYTSKERLKDLATKINHYSSPCEGAVSINCHLPQVGCDANGNQTTTTTSTTTTTTTP